MISGLKLLNLANGRFQIAYDFVKVLNPELEGKTKYVYHVCPYDSYHPTPGIGPDELAEKGDPDTLYAFFTNCADLYKIGRHGPMLTTREHLKELTDDNRELNLLILREWDQGPYAGKPYAWAFMLMDCTGGEQQIGTSFCFVKKD